MLILVLNQKESACLLSSDFRSENPLTQTRTFHTRNRYAQPKKTDKMKKLLVLKASEDIEQAEIDNIVNQILLYKIKSDVFEINSLSDLKQALQNGTKYDYIYLATHGCDTDFGNISGSLNVTWIQFAALICASECNKPGSIFLHSCCRGGLNQVAWKMFHCCENIEFICGPRNNILPVDLVISFNLFLFHREVRNLDPVVCADKVRQAIDVRLVCYDRLDIEVDPAYMQHCELISDEVIEAFNEMD